MHFKKSQHCIGSLILFIGLCIILFGHPLSSYAGETVNSTVGEKTEYVYKTSYGGNLQFKTSYNEYCDVVVKNMSSSNDEYWYTLYIYPKAAAGKTKGDTYVSVYDPDSESEIDYLMVHTELGVQDLTICNGEYVDIEICDILEYTGDLSAKIKKLYITGDGNGASLSIGAYKQKSLSMTDTSIDDMGRVFYKYKAMGSFAVTGKYNAQIWDADTGKIYKQINLNITDHSYDDGKVIKDSTCIKEGEIKYTCTECGNEKIESLPLAEHSPEKVEAVNATCEKSGQTEGSRCAICKKVLSGCESVAVLGHEYGSWKTNGSATHYRICSRCELKNTEYHNWDDGKITSEPTCTESGTKTFLCKDCGEIKETKISATGHNYGEWKSDGKNTHSKLCSNDNDKVTEAHSWDSGTVSVSPSCTETGIKTYKCDICNELKKEEISATGHKWNIEATIDKKPTCTENGSRSIHCSVCDVVKDGSTESIPATGHEFGAWTTIKSPNCVDKGSEARTCKICEYKETKDVDAKGHEWESVYTTDKESTCIEDGSESIHCKNCDVIKDSRGISAKGHDYETITIKASLKSDGLSYDLCKTCQHKDAERTIFKPVGFALSVANYTYNAKTVTPAVVVRDSKGLVLKKGADYDISYASGRKNVGRYAVKVTFKGEYDGIKTMYFTINPKAPAIKAPAAASKSFTAKWSKVVGQATGYQIIYASNSKFTSGKKTVNVGNYKTTSKKITKLKSKSKYYVKVRTYKTVNGTKYYSGWSKVKTVKTK